MISRPKEKKLYDPNAPTVKINTRNDHVEEDKKKEKAKNPLQEIYSFILKSEKSLEKNSMPFELRISLAEQYDLIIKNDFRLSVKYDLDNRKWKHCVYNLIAKERSKFKVLGKEEIKEWNTFLEKMMENYKEIIVLLKESHPGKLYWTPMLNHLADLHRYRAQYFSDDKEGDWKTCRNYYLELADHLPTNGHAWSQLGLVASSRKLFLEAIMMYLRALNVSKPFASAREMVLASYHDALGLNAQKSMIVDSNDASIIKIEKLFLELSQIIFSKIGVDGYQIHLTEFAKSLPNLNCLSALDIKNQFSWWFVISIIIIGNANSIHQNNSYDDIAKGVLTAKSMDLIFIMLTFCISNINSKCKEPYQMFIQILLSYLCNLPIDLYFEKFSLVCPSWCEKFEPIYRDYPNDQYLTEIFNSMPQAPEDSLIRGFTPIAMSKGKYPATLKIQEYDFPEYEFRNERIRLLLGYLIKKFKSHLAIANLKLTDCADIDNLEQIEQESPTKSQTQIETYSENIKHPKEPIVYSQTGRKLEFSFEEFENEKQVQEDIQKSEIKYSLFEDMHLDSEEEDDEQIQALKSKKENLAQTLSTKKNKTVDGCTTLVFDTNCYLSSGKEIMKIMESKVWDIMVPLAVITELYGLLNNQSKSENAAKMIEFFDKNFGQGKFYVETFNGTTLHSLKYRFENWAEGYETVDDVILAMVQKHPEACLITNDINLRLKARNAGVVVLESVSSIRKRQN